jgi:excisionase family DNA binding protein
VGAGGARRVREKASVERLLPIDAPAIRLSEVARRLAISRASAYRLVRSGQLCGVRVGTTWRVLQTDFDAYLDRMRTDAERRYRRARS